MMPKQLPDVINDKGYQKEAEDFAKGIMEGKAFFRTCKGFYEFPEYMMSALEKAYLYGAQSAVRVGYMLKDRDYEETLKMYKKQLEELKQANGVEDWHEWSKNTDDVPPQNTLCLLRVEYRKFFADKVEVGYFTSVLGDYGWSDDYFGDIDGYEVKVTHWKPINKPKGVEK